MYLDQSERSFCSLVWEMFKFQRSNGGFGESGSQDGIIIQNEKWWLFCVYNVYFTALKEKCDTTEQMKDIRLSILNVLLMLWKWCIVFREKMEFCALWRDHGYCSFTTRVGGKILNQVLLEVLMNCTKHFDLSISLTASYVTIFMICGVCRLYFSGLVCSVPSLDECLIEINYGRFCVAPSKLCRLIWRRVWFICNVRRCFY